MRPLEAQLEAAWPRGRWGDVGVLVAVSGGADSVALLRALDKLVGSDPRRLVIAHYNHRFRGSESDADEQFVTELASRWKLPIEVGRRESSAETASSPDRREEAARDERYRFFQSAAERRGARYVATAHTADDQAETVLHRILRGTSIAGLAGMPRVRPLSEATTLVRPLLGVRRTEILAYLRELGQDHRVDSSNQQLDFTRNRLRHELLPQLERDYNPRVVDALLRLSQLATETQETINRAVAQLAAVAVRQPSQGAEPIGIDCRRILDCTRHVVRELFVHVWRERGWPEQAMGFTEWERLAELALSDVPEREQSFPWSVRVWRDAHMLYLQRPE